MNRMQFIGLTLSEVENIVVDFGYGKEHAHKICVSVYRKRIRSFLEIEEIPLILRKKLADSHSIEFPNIQKSEVSADGTIKYLFLDKECNPFETAYMPGSKRNTICISTQSGCRMGCSFCQTGSMGFRNNLSSSQIVGQLMGIKESANVNRIVLMGMGEPLDNFFEVSKSLEILTASWGCAFGASKITVSTVGVFPELEKLISHRRCNIAVSIHSPWPEERAKLMPVERIYPLNGILNFLKQNPLKKPLRLSFEYLVMHGGNDSDRDALELVRILHGFNAHVNVIPHNIYDNQEDTINFAKQFQKKLNQLGLSSTLRTSRGLDIAVACGMMAAKGF